MTDDRRRGPRLERVRTVDLLPGAVIHVQGVTHVKTGWAEVRSVSARPAPSGLFFVSTDRGTFLAAEDVEHGVAP